MGERPLGEQAAGAVGEQAVGEQASRWLLKCRLSLDGVLNDGSESKLCGDRLENRLSTLS